MFTLNKSFVLIGRNGQFTRIRIQHCGNEGVNADIDNV